MQNKLFEQETGEKPYLRFDGRKKKPMSILDMRHQNSIFSTQVQSMQTGESPKMRDVVSLHQQFEG